jgi:predicted NUDIX family phosphoesterase
MYRKDLILAINREKLLEDKRLFQGFMSVENSSNYLDYILNNSVFMDRHAMPGDYNSNYKEILTYSILANLENNRFFMYNVFSENSETLTKAALVKPKEVWSFGVLENIFPGDVFDGVLDGCKIPYRHFSFVSDMQSKLSKNINILGEMEKPQLLGFLNSDANAFTTNKLGIAYLIPTNTTVAAMNPKIASVDSGIEKGYMASFELLEEKLNDNKIFVGQWSKQIMPSLSKMYYSDVKK